MAQVPPNALLYLQKNNYLYFITLNFLSNPRLPDWCQIQLGKRTSDPVREFVTLVTMVRAYDQGGGWRRPSSRQVSS